MIRQLSAFMMPHMFCICDDPSHHEVRAALLSCFLGFVGPVFVNKIMASQFLVDPCNSVVQEISNLLGVLGVSFVVI